MENPLTTEFVGDLNGFSIITSDTFVEYKNVRRSFFECWFSLPWEPTLKTKIRVIPKDGFAVDEEQRKIVIHPDNLDDFMKSLEKLKCKS